MSYKTIASYVGKILLLSAFFYIVPCLVALIYGEYAQIPALAAASLVALAAGGVLLLFREKGRKLRTKESLVVVGLSWILISAIGALPFFSTDVFRIISTVFSKPFRALRRRAQRF
ncbi:MAG: hypothetical protein ACLR06_10915 [Christensenellaceae bacterium]